MRKPFQLIMLSAMYENGGNTTHRFLDGHPELNVYPFESQLGTSLVNDYLSSVFPIKYRWPSFPLEGSLEQDYELIIDEELKRHIKTPAASKFKSAKMEMDDANRKIVFLHELKNKPRTTASIIEAFFKSTFIAWKNHHHEAPASTYVGYSPIIGVDAALMIRDFPSIKIVHVVRNPFSAYADTKKRAVPLSLERYISSWNIVQQYATMYERMFPQNVRVVRFEDLIQNPTTFFGKLCPFIGISMHKSLLTPSWNSSHLSSLSPWGTVRTPTEKANKDTMDELSSAEKTSITMMTKPWLEYFNYSEFK